jgi:site-specific DNA-methyltransferase (adenine-specific)
MNRIFHGDCFDILQKLPKKSVRMIYIDPPFNTGKTQKRDRIKVIQDDNGTRKGFGDKSYRVVTQDEFGSYVDSFGDFVEFLMPSIRESLRVLTDNGSLFVHLDYREVHYIKVELDRLLGRDHFMNEIIWAFDYGGRSKSKWSCKHNTILWYVKDPKNYVFNFDAMERIPYMAPLMVGEEKAARGKTLTDSWWHTIVPTNSKEKTGYPTQKPIGVVQRFVKVHSNPGDTVLDFFAGSGTLGEAAGNNGREFVLIDSNKTAIDVMKKRLKRFKPVIE